MGRLTLWIFLILGVILPNPLAGQAIGGFEDPVSWSYSVARESDSVYVLTFKAGIEKDWHLYSQHTADGGALPTEFEFPGAGSNYELLGPVGESRTYVEYNDIFEVDETFFKDTAEFTQRIRLDQPVGEPLEISVYYQVCKEVCIPGEYHFSVSLDGSDNSASVVAPDARSEQLGSELVLDLKDRELLQESGADGSQVQGFWVLFGLGFLGGLIALLTPCVFPLIPLTVSFFTKRAESSSGGLGGALFYALCIVLIYLLLSLPFHLFDSVDSQILNTIATNIWLNLFFFVVFLFFAFSFFGYYEITLPSSWANRADAASRKAGGALGIFFMALTLAIVSFSCTGPILGGLLGSTALAEGDVAWNLTAGMFGFGCALALPFGLFALFPSWLRKLPRSGSWMDTVKVVLGFLELGLALKFLSNADLVGHWGLLKREVFLGLWLVLALGLSLYLFGWVRLKPSAGARSRSVWRYAGAFVSLGFAAYLAYGLFTGLPLKALSGFPPPDFYTLRAQETDCPLGLDCYKDFEEGLERSQATGKPILLDFTGWACVNCRKMEEQVWSQPEVYRLLKEEYVLISLYVDDRASLPAEEQFVFQFASGATKRVRTVGDRWSAFQAANFGAVSQPYYVQLSPDLQVLNPAMQNTDAATYQEWLSSGIQRLEANVGSLSTFAAPAR